MAAANPKIVLSASRDIPFNKLVLLQAKGAVALRELGLRIPSTANRDASSRLDWTSKLRSLPKGCALTEKAGSQ